MVKAKADIIQNTSSDLLTGRVTCLRGGSGNVDYHDDATRERDIPDPSGYYSKITGRFLHHGGTNGSGNWEH